MKKNFFILIIFSLGQYAFAQTAVRNEPRHHNVFENDYVRVLDVYIAPNDTTQFHIHATPSVFISLSKTATGSQLIDQNPIKNISVAGSIRYDSLVTPRIHRVWNDDTAWYHVMDVELVAGKPHINEPALQNSSLQLLDDKPLVRTYALQLIKGGSFKLPLSKAGYLLVNTGEADITFQSKDINEHRFMKAGHYYWTEGAKILMTGNNDITFALLQLK
ncbi:MAG: hypothetical protein ABIO55_10005 [Ginsengibacter sp.]